jgi:hypothetical protein
MSKSDSGQCLDRANEQLALYRRMSPLPLKSLRRALMTQNLVSQQDFQTLLLHQLLDQSKRQVAGLRTVKALQKHKAARQTLAIIITLKDYWQRGWGRSQLDAGQLTLQHYHGPRTPTIAALVFLRTGNPVLNSETSK